MILEVFSNLNSFMILLYSGGIFIPGYVGSDAMVVLSPLGQAAKYQDSADTPRAIGLLAPTVVQVAVWPHCILSSTSEQGGDQQITTQTQYKALPALRFSGCQIIWTFMNGKHYSSPALGKWIYKSSPQQGHKHKFQIPTQEEKAEWEKDECS